MQKGSQASCTVNSPVDYLYSSNIIPVEYKCQHNLLFYPPLCLLFGEVTSLNVQVTQWHIHWFHLINKPLDLNSLYGVHVHRERMENLDKRKPCQQFVELLIHAHLFFSIFTMHCLFSFCANEPFSERSHLMICISWCKLFFRTFSKMCSQSDGWPHMDKNTARGWCKVKAHLSIATSLLGFTPIWGNCTFNPDGRDLRFGAVHESASLQLLSFNAGVK